MGTLGSLFSRLVCSDCPQDRLWLFASLEISTMETKRFGRSTFTQTCDDANPWLTTCALLQFQTCQSETWDRKQRKAKPTNNNSKDPFSQTCIANKRRRTTKSHWPKVPPLLLLPPSLYQCLFVSTIIALLRLFQIFELPHDQLTVFCQIMHLPLSTYHLPASHRVNLNTLLCACAHLCSGALCVSIVLAVTCELMLMPHSLCYCSTKSA